MKPIDKISEVLGRGVSWLSALLVVVIVADVVLRYFFSITSAASFELEWHLFATLFLLGAAWTLKEDRHVRVDVFYQAFSNRQKAWVNLLGTLLLLLPFCVVGLLQSIPFVKSSYILNEISPQPGGLPARYLIKSTIPLGFFTLGLQGVSLVFTCIQTITKHD